MMSISAKDVQKGDRVAFQQGNRRYLGRVVGVRCNKRSVTVSFGSGLSARLKLDHPVIRK
jgi:hypothetical protein